MRWTLVAVVCASLGCAGVVFTGAPVEGVSLDALSGCATKRPVELDIQAWIPHQEAAVVGVVEKSGCFAVSEGRLDGVDRFEMRFAADVTGGELLQALVFPWSWFVVPMRSRVSCELTYTPTGSPPILLSSRPHEISKTSSQPEGSVGFSHDNHAQAEIAKQCATEFLLELERQGAL